MNLTELLKSEIEATYAATEGLIKMVEPDAIGWKPETGTNWMTTGQLLMHIVMACGACCKGFVTGDWGLPEGVSFENMSPEDMLPPAEKLPAVETVEQALETLGEDKKIALEMVDLAGEEDLANKQVAAPWCPQESFALGRHLLQMVGHLALHKAQLFYYLKLMGKPVNTGHLFGM